MSVPLGWVHLIQSCFQWVTSPTFLSQLKSLAHSSRTGVQALALLSETPRLHCWQTAVSVCSFTPASASGQAGDFPTSLHYMA